MAGKNKGIGALAGIAAGAALGAVAIVLTDKKKRSQLQKLIGDLGKQGTKQFKDVQNKAEEAKKQLMEMVNEEKPKAVKTPVKKRAVKSVKIKAKV
ncbi:MAG: hypothetical protein Q8Q24_01265 [bacterium]|nr:hypothetical protein [bacterium]